ncbi:MAG: hypothetical protein KDK36_12320 [Leptospiraceae bacterium]|nr:hypothetical protein [Leptospiraceae bacterium]
MTIFNNLFQIIKRKQIGIILFLLFSIPILGDDFDPSLFTPKGCNSNDLNCGFVPSSQKDYRSFAVSPNSNKRYRGLPSSHDLSDTMPPVGSQGTQGSCVGWATTYALKSFQEKQERNWSYDIKWELKKVPAGGNMYYLVYQPAGKMSTVFSPAFTYNQINRGVDGGSSIGTALDLITEKGALPYNQMPYNEKDYRTKPNSSQLNNAIKFKGLRYYRVDFRNPTAMKTEIYKGNPIVIGMLVDDGFQKMKKGVYDRPAGSPKGGHAMTIVGYDDDKVSPNGHKGAYKLINSWGQSWGENGFGWVSYKAMASLNREAWVLIDEVTEQKNDDSPPVVPSKTSIKAPSDVTASRGSFSNKIVVKWSNVSNANVYIIQRAEGNDREDFEDLAYTEELLYEDSAIEADKSYHYRIISGLVEEEKETYSEPEDSPIAEGFAKTEVVKKPSKISGVDLALEKNNRVKISWTEDESTTKYQVGRYDTKNKKWKLIAKTSNSNYTDKRPIKGYKNYYIIRGTNNKGSGSWSQAKEVFISNKSKNSIPSTITDLSAGRGEIGKINLTWSKSDGANLYAIYRFLISQNSWAKTEIVYTNSYTDTSNEAQKGNPIAYVVVAGNSSGYSEYSNYAYGVATSSSLAKRGNVLPPPANLKVKIKNGTASLSWDKVKGADEYYVFYKERGDDELEFVKSSGTKTKFDFKIPSKGESYFVAVKSKSTLGGESIPSNLVPVFEPKPFVKKSSRFLKEAGIENFTGKWKGSFWDGKKSIQNIELEISSNGNHFKAQIKSNGKSIGNYEGSYAAMSDYLETENFKMHAKGPEGKISEIAELVIENKKISKSEVEIGLTRE